MSVILMCMGRLKKHTKNKTPPVFAHLPLIVGVVVLVATVFSVAPGLMLGWELVVFRFINNLSDSQRLIWLAITGFGSVFCLFALTLLLIARRYYRLAVRLFGLGVFTLVASELIKIVVARPRPALLIDHVHVRQMMIGNGYPSSHTALATIMAITLVRVLPTRSRWVASVWIGLVAISRIYLGVHAPADVIGGVAVGTVIISVSDLTTDKIKRVTKITGLKLAKQKSKA